MVVWVLGGFSNFGGLQFFGGVSNFFGGPPIFLGGPPIFRGGGGLQFFFFFFNFFSPKFLLGCTNPPAPPPRWSMRGRYASYWNAFLFDMYSLLDIDYQGLILAVDSLQIKIKYFYMPH